jgi:hypothetical protein
MRRGPGADSCCESQKNSARFIAKQFHFRYLLSIFVFRRDCSAFDALPGRAADLKDRWRSGAKDGGR